VAARQDRLGVVVLVHGLLRTHRSMRTAARAARRRGYAVINWHYASSRHGISDHAAALDRELGPTLAAAPGPVHFLTHSMGGIVVRAYLASSSPPHVGRVVMLGPPNEGNEIAQHLRHNHVFRWLMGQSGQELGIGVESVPRRLPAVDFELGVVAGARRRPALFGAWIGTPNDGMVSVAATRVAGMRDHVVIRGGHALLPANPRALRQAFAFFETGRFDRTIPGVVA
jgi:pimeloyl-ACP methyl ester carboxylesterase